MTRHSSLANLLTHGPVYWALLGLFFCFTLFRLSGVERLAMLVFLPALFAASFLAWRRPRAEHALTLGVGVFMVSTFTVILWRSGPSLYGFAFLGLGIWEILQSALFWNEEYQEGDELDEDREKRLRKRKRIAELLVADDPDELLAVVFKRIVRRYGDDLDARDLREHERVFLLAYHAWGIIGNGGFHYLFEQDLRGDPYFEETAAAFAAIGCDAAAEAFAKVFRLFPGGRPPSDRAERLRLYRRGPGDRRGPIDEQFFAAKKEIQRCLFAYLQTHREEFTELDRWPRRRRPEKKRKRRPRAGESEGPTAGDLVESLPHWARVAFSVRCGRRIWPLFTANWPNSLDEHSQAVTRALELAETSAASARPADGLEEARSNALQTAGQAMLAMYGIILEDDDQEPLPSDGNAALVALFVAKTAEKAAEAANSSPDKSADLVLEAFGFARQTAGDTSDLIQTLWNELTQLERIARRGQWTDQTPVPSDVWDLLH